MEDKIKNPEIQNSQHFGTNLSLESIKIIAESIGIGNYMLIILTIYTTNLMILQETCQMQQQRN